MATEPIHYGSFRGRPGYQDPKPPELATPDELFWRFQNAYRDLMASWPPSAMVVTVDLTKR